jgi:cytochrome c biogenesis protein CcdA
LNTIFYTLSLSLVDSLTTTQQIIIFAILLTTEKPLRNSLSYLAGLGGAYVVCGIGGYLALDELRVFLSRFFPSTTTLSDPLYYQAEFLMGVIMAAIGLWLFFRQKKAGQSRAEIFILSKLLKIKGWVAFVLGLFISVTSFPGSPPYLIALGSYSSLHLGLSAVVGFILIYNLGYVSPMILLLLIYLFARKETGNSHDSLQQQTKRLNRHLTTWVWLGFGLFSMVDAGCYFVLGHAMIRGRFF